MKRSQLFCLLFRMKKNKETFAYVNGNLITACEECNTAKNKTVLRDEEKLLAEVERRNKEAGISPDAEIKFSKRNYERD